MALVGRTRTVSATRENLPSDPGFTHKAVEPMPVGSLGVPARRVACLSSEADPPHGTRLATAPKPETALPVPVRNVSRETKREHPRPADRGAGAQSLTGPRLLGSDRADAREWVRRAAPRQPGGPDEARQSPAAAAPAGRT